MCHRFQGCTSRVRGLAVPFRQSTAANPGERAADGGGVTIDVPTDRQLPNQQTRLPSQGTAAASVSLPYRGWPRLISRPQRAVPC